MFFYLTDPKIQIQIITYNTKKWNKNPKDTSYFNTYIKHTIIQPSDY